MLWRRVSVAVLFLTLAACSNNLVRPVSSGSTDTALIKGVTLSGRITQLAFYDKCGGDLTGLTVPAKVNYRDTDFNKPAVEIPTGQRIYFTYGTIDSATNCKVLFSLVPQPQHTYNVGYYRKFGGCHVDVRSQSGNAIKTLTFYTEKPSQPWLSCAAL